MTSQEQTRRRRWGLMLGFGAAVAVAATFGSIAYVEQIRSAEYQRREITERVCERQDQVIAVLRVLVSDERERLAFPEGNPGLVRSNYLVRRQIDRILASPCDHHQGER